MLEGALFSWSSHPRCPLVLNTISILITLWGLSLALTIFPLDSRMEYLAWMSSRVFWTQHVGNLEDFNFRHGSTVDSVNSKIIKGSGFKSPASFLIPLLKNFSCTRINALANPVSLTLSLFWIWLLLSLPFYHQFIFYGSISPSGFFLFLFFNILFIY